MSVFMQWISENVLSQNAELFETESAKCSILFKFENLNN